MSFKSVAEFLALKGDDAPTTAERKLIEATQAGEACVLFDGEPSLPTEASKESGETHIRSNLLRLLITGGTPTCNLHERGVTLIGGWIDGPLDLAYCTARGQTVLRWCKFPERPRLDQAQFHLLGFDDSAFDDGLFAQGLRVKGSLFLKRITASGTIAVNRAKIGGQLSCTGATLDGGKDATGGQIMALNAQGVEVGQDLFLDTLTATGRVDVNGAKIGGQLACKGAKLYGGQDAEDGQIMALNAQGVVVGDSLFLDTLTATGTVHLNGAKISGQLSCIGATLDGGKDADDGQIEALNAQRVEVAQSFLFRDVAQVTGLINLTAAHVGDLVDDMNRWPVATDQLILDGFTYDRLAGAAPTTLAARRKWLAAGSHWQGEFRPQPYTQLARVLRQMGHAGEARQVLIEAAIVEAKTFQKQHRARRRFARAVRLFSRHPSKAGGQAIKASLGQLPQSLQVEATEITSLFLRYHLPFPAPADAPPPPDPLTLGYARQDFRNRLWWRATGSRLAILGSRVKHGFLSRIVGHGHAPQRAITAVILSSILAAVGYHFAWQVGALVPNSDIVLTSFNWWWAMKDQALTPTEGWTATGTAQHYETFYSLAYAFDVIVPIVDLGQQSAWSATTVTWAGWWTRVLTMVLEVWGWVVTALGAAAVTGLVQRNQPD